MTGGDSPPASHPCALAMLEAAVDAAVGTSFGHLSTNELVAVACRLQTLSARLDSVRSRILGQAVSAAKEQPGVMRELGFRTPAQAVVAGTGASAHEVRAVASAGSWLTDFPVFAQALADGVLTLRHIRELKRLDNPATHDDLILAQDELVTAARQHDFVEFTHRVATWAINHDPHGNTATDQIEATSCSMTKHSDGSITGRFRLDPLSAAAVGPALENEVERLFNQQSADKAANGARSTTRTARTADRRRGQALVGLIVGGAEAPGSATATPLVNLVLGQLLARNLLDRLADPSAEPVEMNRDDPDRRCELIDGTPIHPNLAMIALAAARFRRIVLDARSRPIDVSYSSRGFPPDIKQILLVAARGRCRIPGCDASYYWLQADHRLPHARGGATSLANGQVLCGPDNRWKKDRVDPAA